MMDTDTNATDTNATDTNLRIRMLRMYGLPYGWIKSREMNSNCLNVMVHLSP